MFLHCIIVFSPYWADFELKFELAAGRLIFAQSYIYGYLTALSRRWDINE
jgi:hypothetical protein